MQPPSHRGASSPALQCLATFTDDFRVIYSHLKTRVFQPVAHDSNYLSTLKILPLGSMCVLHFGLQVKFLVLICKTTLALSRVL